MQDIHRPDIDKAPKMAAISESVKTSLAGLLPYLTVHASDNFLSTVTIKGTKEPKDKWPNKIFENCTYFIINIKSMNGKRYYEPTDPSITVEVISGHSIPKFRKYTASPEKVIAKIKVWIESINKAN